MRVKNTRQFIRVIDAARITQAVTGRELCRRAGTSPATYQHVVATPGAEIKLDTAVKFAEALGMEIIMNKKMVR